MNISKGEWRFLGIVMLVVAITVFLPMIIGYKMTPDRSNFLFERNVNIGDYQVYLSYIEQAKHGIYFFQDLFTSEPQKVGVLYSFWLLVGIISKIFHIPTIIAPHIASLLLIPLFLISAYHFVSFFFEEGIKRKVGFILLIFGSGIAGYILFTHNAFFKSDFFPSITVQEAFSLNTLSSPAHLIASATLLMLIFLFSFYAFEDYKFRYSAWAGIFVFLLLSFHPYHVYTIFIVLLFFIITESIIDKKISLHHLSHYLTLLIFSIPPVFYHLWTIQNIPVRHEVFLQNITLTSSLALVLLDYSALITLDVFGVLYLLRHKLIIKKRNVFLVVWLVTQSLLLYLPVSTQRRLFEGLNIPIMILGTYGLFFLHDWATKKMFLGKQASILMIIFFALIFVGPNIPVAFSNITFYSASKTPSAFPKAYFSDDNKDAMLWIKNNTLKDSIILSSIENGNNVPFISLRHVYIGHAHETAYYNLKKKRLELFFNHDTSQDREVFLHENNIGYVFWGLEEKAMTNAFNPDKEAFLQKVYSNNSVSLYKVKP